MSVSRSKVLNHHHQVLDTRYVKVEVEHQNETEVALAPGEGCYAAVNRQVPSSPDPLHNR